MKKILILNGSFCELPVIQKAKELGYYVITTGNMPHLIGHQYSDEYINADYSDKERILEIVKENNIDHIFSCANDFGVLTASYVAEKMGWSGHDSYETAVLLHHKDKFKKFINENHFPSPISTIFINEKEAKEFVQDVEYPIIVKANDLTGGKGILRANNYDEAVFAIENAFSRSRDKHVVIEPFIEGTQQSLDLFLANKKVIAAVSNDCYSPINPYLIQSETLPAKNIEEVKKILIPIAEEIANKLNLADGILGLQYIVRNGEVFIIETMRRIFGNQYLMLATKNTGFDWHLAQLKAELGESCQNMKCEKPEMPYCGHHGIMATRNGKVKGYTIDPSIEKHIFHKIEMIQPGGVIQDYLNERVAYIYYHYDNPEEMNDAVKKFNDLITIEFEDEN